MRCLRPQRTCICRLVTPIAHSVEVLILQHPLEVANAKGSARLLHLCLPHSRLAVGEAFPERQLRELLFEPFPDAQAAAPAPRQAILLYPERPEDDAGGTAAPACAGDAAPGHLRLVILDGTWRKSRKMLHLNPLLQQLPRMPLRNAPASQYLIRKAHAPDQLSTLEAAAHALMRLEHDDGKYLPLFKAFDEFVTQVASFAKPLPIAG